MDEDSSAISEEKEREAERCWTEEYKGASRKWLIRDASFRLPPEPFCSTMKDTFRYPEPDPTDEQRIGRRTATLLERFYKEAAEEIERERTLCEEPPHRCTEYDGNFRIPGFEPDDEYYTKNKELYEKYPLYSTHAASFWNHKLEENPRENLDGLSKITDRKAPFKKCSYFSKPISEVYDVQYL